MMKHRATVFPLGLALLGSLPGQLRADENTWIPEGAGSVPAAGFVVDLSSRAEVQSFYQTVYRASERVESSMGWTGSFDPLTGTVGTTSLAYREHIRRRVNFFRGQAGVPADVTFAAQDAVNLVPGPPGTTVPAGTSKTYCSMQSAYMNAMEAWYAGPDFELTHNPPNSFFNWSSYAWNASAHGNLTVGYWGPGAIDAYMLDEDGGSDLYTNENVGHRRWILFPRTLDMASGDVPAGTVTQDGVKYDVNGANTLYVVGNFRPAAAARFTIWPNEGYFPAELVPGRWSLAWPGADFSAATVTMTGPGGSIPVTVISRTAQVGENAIVWEPTGLPSAALADQTVTVTVSGMSGGGVPSVKTWQTVLFPVDVAASVLALSGPAALPKAGGFYPFTQVAGARGYRLQVSSAAAAADYLQGAEDANAADLLLQTTGTYPARQAAQTLPNGVVFTPRTGSRALHLTFPRDGADQIVELTPEFMAGATSRVDYYNCFRWVFDTSRLSLEISTDGGIVWREIDGRNGAYALEADNLYDSSLWDRTGTGGNAPLWKLRSVSLAAYAGKAVRLRFVFRSGANVFYGEDQMYGCFVDDVKLVAGQRLTPRGNEIAAASSPFTLSETTLGTVMNVNDRYVLRAAPVSGTRRLGWTNLLSVTVSSLTGYDAWVAGYYPGATGGAAGDDDKDQLSNLMEYAFGTNPLSGLSGPGQMPQAVVGPSAMTMNFSLSPTVTGVTVKVQSSQNLQSWTDLVNGAAAPAHAYSVPVAGRERQWMRVKVTRP
jgi:hypothetical protein